jgi:hypothetical protein
MCDYTQAVDENMLHGKVVTDVNTMGIGSGMPQRPKRYFKHPLDDVNNV